jgi:uncharacterized repeat protein (TIGR03803 family)
VGSPGQYQSCNVRINLRAGHFRLALAIVLGLVIVVPTRTAQAQVFTVIHNFQGGADGAEPAYGLTIDSSGTIYGSTFLNDAGTGTIYALANQGSGWVLDPLYMFSGGSDGGVPYAGVIFGPDGTLYGTTAFGGVGTCQTGGGKTGCGTAFNLKPPSRQPGAPSGFWTETVLYDFTGGGDGATPYGARPIFDKAGNLYGTAFGGGFVNDNCPAGCGLVYELVPSNGSWTEKILYSFTGLPDGSAPWAGVIFDQSGNLYGTTELGGAYGYGTIFELTPSGSGWKEKILYNFQNLDDGGRPYAGLIFDQSGNLYGATTTGGGSNGGTVFELTPSGGSWIFKTLYGFNGRGGQLAKGPTASLVMDNGGNLFGATGGDGAYGYGAVFKLTRSGNSWSYTSLYDFTNGSDGQIPRTNLVFDKYGNLYGTAAGGQTLPDCGGPCGLVFEVTFPMQYVAVTPCRVVDTRGANGPFGGPPIQGGTHRDFPLAQSGNPCNIPANAAAYSLNVTAVPNGRLGYLTIWPTGQPQPLASTLNSVDGRVKANAAIVSAGNNAGSVSVFATDTTNVVLDIDGYFAPASDTTLAFYPLPPCRVADTRNPNGPLGGPYLQGGVNRDFPILDASACNIPNSAQAYSLNFTAVPHGSLGYLTVCPTPSDPSQNCPQVSTLNANEGKVTANAAIVAAGTSGEIRTLPKNDTDLIIDINGYFAPPGAQNGLSLYTMTPCRVLDTRPPSGSGPFQFELTPPVDVLNGPCPVAGNAQAYVFNATVVPQGGLGYLTLWPDGLPQPTVSTLNAYDGVVSSNMAIVPAGAGGKVDAYANPLHPSDPTDLTNLVLDISGYFAP